MGPNPYLWFLHSKQRLLEPNNKSLRVPDITCRCVHAIQRAPELLVSMGPNPYLWFFDAKQRLFEQNYKSLWVPDMTCRYVDAKQRV